jgi:hypothetical protein
MSKTSKILTLGTIAAVVWSFVYFRGDLRRYIKMKRM